MTSTSIVIIYQMYGLYHTFNFMTGYKQVNPSVQSIEWRLIVLESVAGVPGFVAAGVETGVLKIYRAYILSSPHCFKDINVILC
jgi:hypothetical protein